MAKSQRQHIGVFLKNVLLPEAAFHLRHSQYTGYLLQGLTSQQTK